MLSHAGADTAIRELADPASPFKTPSGLLTAAMADTLSGANWQRGGGKGGRPQPILDRIKKQLDSEKQDASAPKNAQEMMTVREALAARRKKAIDVPRSA